MHMESLLLGCRAMAYERRCQPITGCSLGPPSFTTATCRCAVLVNDMAEINIDANIVKGSELIQREEEVVELSNGCICCTLRQDLVDEVAKLAKRGTFDYVFIESTGIAEPMQTAESFTMNLGQEDVGEEGSEIEAKDKGRWATAAAASPSRTPLKRRAPPPPKHTAHSVLKVHLVSSSTTTFIALYVVHLVSAWCAPRHHTTE